MTSISWKLNRLRAMSGPEVMHRTCRWIGHRAEKNLIAIGWQPRPNHPVEHKDSLFPELDGWREAWVTKFDLNHEKLDDLISGKIDLFSYESLRAGKPVNWHRDPLTLKTSPLVFGKTLDYRDDTEIGDVKVLWELGRHQHLVSLAVAYVVSGETACRNTVVNQIEGWIRDNPFGLGIHWCSSLESSLRLISWAVIHSLLTLRGHKKGLFSVVSAPDKLGLAIYQQAWFIRNYLSRYSSGNNHLIGELTGLWVTCNVFDLGPTGEKWMRFAQMELEQQVRAQIYSDGVDKEQAIYYHLWVLEYLLIAWLIGERSRQPFSLSYRDRILLMSKFLRDVSLENGDPPQIGDGDDGFVTRFEPSWPPHPYNDVQSAIATIFGNVSLAIYRQQSQKSFWYAMIAGTLPADNANTRVLPAEDYPIIYQEGGYAILGDESLKLVFDAGSLGYPSIASHGHADALSFCLGLDDQWWLIDPGTYAYHSEAEWRDYFRGTSAHNTLAINGLNQSKIGGNFLWLDRAHAELDASGRKSNGSQWVRGHHDGYKAIGVIHQREISYSSITRTIDINDCIDNESSTESLQISAYFHFAPNIDLAIDDLQCLATKPGREEYLRIYLDHKYNWEIVKGQIDPIHGWYSPSLGSKVPAAVLIGNRKAPSPEKLTTRIEVCSVK